MKPILLLLGILACASMIVKTTTDVVRVAPPTPRPKVAPIPEWRAPTNLLQSSGELGKTKRIYQGSK
jgi:hypothetical protein